MEEVHYPLMNVLLWKRPRSNVWPSGGRDAVLPDGRPSQRCVGCLLTNVSGPGC